MVAISRILLIETVVPESVETTVLLKVASFQVEICRNLEEAVNRYGLYSDTEHKFDLVIADLREKDRETMERYYRAGIFERLILLRRHLSCSTHFCLSSSYANLCHSAALLDCIDALQSSDQAEPFHNYGGRPAASHAIK